MIGDMWKFNRINKRHMAIKNVWQTFVIINCLIKHATIKESVANIGELSFDIV